MTRKDRAHAREYDHMDGFARIPRLRALMSDVLKALMDTPSEAFATFEQRMRKVRLEDALLHFGFHEDRLQEISAEMDADYRKDLGLEVAA